MINMWVVAKGIGSKTHVHLYKVIGDHNFFFCSFLQPVAIKMVSLLTAIINGSKTEVKLR